MQDCTATFDCISTLYYHVNIEIPLKWHFFFNRIQGKSMLENKKLSDREIMCQFLRRIPIQNRTIAYDIVNRDSNEKQVFKAGDNNVM